MKLLSATLALALATAANVQAQPKPAPKASMQGMPAGHQMAGSSMVMADGVGVIRGIDPAAGMVTLEHAPIPALKWPAMTMKLNANPPSLLKGLSVGQAVKFQLMQMGDDTHITSIKPN